MIVGKSEIICVGMVCVDVLSKTVDSFPKKGKLILVDSITMQIGGCAANAAICLSRIGIGSSIVGKIGNDNLGRILHEKLLKEEVKTSGLITGEEISTSSSMVFISSDGERSVIHSFGANKDFCFEDIDPDVIKGKKIMLIAGTFLMPAFDGKGTEKMLRLAKENEVLCCMDTAWDSTGEWIKKIESTFQYLDWFMPSYDEALELSKKKTSEEMALFFNQKGVANVIIKLNSEGCYVKEENREGYYVPAYKRIQSVDASGAGDAFCAGFIAGLHEGWEIVKCAKFANAVGAHCITKIGTTEGVKSMKETLDFMRSYENASTQ